MCIFNGNITEVSNTLIFTGAVMPAKIITKYVGGEKKTFKTSAGNPLQLMVYSNKVHADNQAAMVLPFPLLPGQPNRFKLFDFSKYSEIFEDLELLFPTEELPELDMRTFTNSVTNDKLTVQFVGNYKVSIVPTLNHFDKLDTEQFNLDTDVKSLLTRYYKENYGFIVCQLTQFSRSNQFHPIAYVHEIRSDKKLFIPTRHYHKTRSNNAFSKYYNPTEPNLTELRNSELLDEDDLNGFMYNTLMLEDKWMNLNSRRRDVNSYKQQSDDQDWDHDIYVLNLQRIMYNPLLKKPGSRVIEADKNKLDRFYSYIDADKLPIDINIPIPKKLYKIHINKNYKRSEERRVGKECRSRWSPYH